MTAVGEYWTSPDLTVTITDKEAIYAFAVLDECDWEIVEAGLPVDAVDTSGNPIDRNNRNVRLMFLAEAVALARGAESGEGVDLLGNPEYVVLINVLLDSFDRIMPEATS